MSAAQTTFESLANRLWPTRQDYVSVAQVVEQTSLSERSVRRMIADRRLESCKLGGRRLVKVSSLENLLQK